MLRATVRLGRTAVRPDHAGEYAVTLDGEVPFGPDDPEGVLEKVAELFDLAGEALARVMERGRESQPGAGAKENGYAAEPAVHPQTVTPRPSPGGTRAEAATPKQVQFLHNLAKRKGLSPEDLDATVRRVVGRAKRPGELTKREAGQVIDHLTNLESEATT